MTKKLANVRKTGDHARVRGAGNARRTSSRVHREGALDQLEHELPENLAEFSHRMRRRLTQLERQLEHARDAYARRSTRVLRSASLQLGRFEAMGEKHWKRLTNEARRDAVKVLRQLEKAIEPPKPVRRKTARKTPPAGRSAASSAG